LKRLAAGTDGYRRALAGQGGKKGPAGSFGRAGDGIKGPAASADRWRRRGEWDERRATYGEFF